MLSNTLAVSRGCNRYRYAIVINRTPTRPYYLRQLPSDHKERGNAREESGYSGHCIAVVVAYVVYPYVALYRLGQAIRQGDATSLETMVDWSAVREGIKEDICDQVIDRPPEAQAGAQLPPFGSGFVRGIAGNASRLAGDASGAGRRRRSARVRAPAARGATVQVSWAFFAGPAAFLVDLNAPGQASPIRLQMDLRYGVWQVTRVWLPPELLPGQRPDLRLHGHRISFAQRQPDVAEMVQ